MVRVPMDPMFEYEILCLKVELIAGSMVFMVPEHVSTRQGRVPTKRSLDGRGEPAQAVSIITRRQKGRFRQIHLARDVLHPVVFARLR